MTQTNVPLKLLKKLHQIMTAMESVPKRGYNKAHNYYYALEYDVLTMFRAQLIEKDVFVVPYTTGANVYPADNKFLTDLAMGYTVYDLESGESIDSAWRGQGVDYGGDKGLYKAFTGGNKYFTLMLCQIPRDDDPEHDKFTDKATNGSRPSKSKWPTKEQKDEIKQLVKERDVPDGALKNIKEQMGYGGGALYETAQAFILQLRKMPLKGEANVS